ncbi:hypothetical protein [Paenarthrobacter sp. JL.01a]|uniref:hypothetical protein n=1 Tax=Paenarthrobacter sp. JL.01a TaxID=2979324 RepID=UPI0021C82AAE|nr:hypothetical protein [Paenarthrobacter sp. JL.01a]UXM93055.1 hypothetical protein N5P29_07000 [Paenarthrobacter sp. JL.01a]
MSSKPRPSRQSRLCAPKPGPLSGALVFPGGPRQSRSPAAALNSARRLESLEASVVLPGHGPALQMPLAEAAAALDS